MYFDGVALYVWELHFKWEYLSQNLCCVKILNLNEFNNNIIMQSKADIC